MYGCNIIKISPFSKFLKERQAGGILYYTTLGLTSHDKRGITKLPPYNIYIYIYIYLYGQIYLCSFVYAIHIIHHYPLVFPTHQSSPPPGACALGAGFGAAFAVGAAASASSSESSSTTWMRLKSELETGEGHQQVHASIFSLTFDIYIYIYNYIYIYIQSKTWSVLHMYTVPRCRDSLCTYV